MKSIAFASLLSVLSFSIAHASPTTSTWTGGVGSFWGSDANWDSFAVPDDDDLAVINGAGLNQPTIFSGNLIEVGSVDLSMGTLTILAGGILYVDDFVISGGTLTGCGTLVYRNSFTNLGGTVSGVSISQGSPPVIAEPASVAMVALGLGAAGLARRRGQRAERAHDAKA